MKRVHVYINGIVQGVCFRAATRRAATDLNLAGWVRNTDDGRVEAVFEGEDLQVDKMLVWCQVGPPAAIVKKVITLKEQYSGDFTGFTIKY